MLERRNDGLEALGQRVGSSAWNQTAAGAHSSWPRIVSRSPGTRRVASGRQVLVVSSPPWPPCSVRTAGYGWAGTVGPGGDTKSFTASGIRNRPVVLTESEIENHYDGFCSGTIWPLYHDAIRPLEFHRHWWYPHEEVNNRFAQAVARAAGAEGRVWVHDYQLQLVPAMVRQRLPRAKIGFFLHIPFPPVDIFERLPWRRQVLEGLLGADYLGFQTRRAVLNFAAAAREISGRLGPGLSS